MTKASSSTRLVTPEPISPTGRYEFLTPVGSLACWVFDPEGQPFVSTDNDTAENMAKSLNKVEFGCECSGSCSSNCKCQ